jgi:hypothetical protein
MDCLFIGLTFDLEEIELKDDGYAESQAFFKERSRVLQSASCNETMTRQLPNNNSQTVSNAVIQVDTQSTAADEPSPKRLRLMSSPQNVGGSHTLIFCSRTNSYNDKTSTT